MHNTRKYCSSNETDVIKLTMPISNMFFVCKKYVFRTLNTQKNDLLYSFAKLFQPVILSPLATCHVSEKAHVNSMIHKLKKTYVKQ